LLHGPVDSYHALLARNYALVSELAVGSDAQWSKYIPERELNYYRDNVDPEKYTNVDWFDFMTRDYTISSKQNFTITGGTDFVNTLRRLVTYRMVIFLIRELRIQKDTRPNSVTTGLISEIILILRSHLLQNFQSI